MSKPRVRMNPAVPEIAVGILEQAGLSVERGEVRLGSFGAEPTFALLPLLTDRIDDALLADVKGLRIVANMAVGTDNVDLAAAERRGVAVSNTPDVLTDATADIAFGLLLAAARNLIWADRYVRSGAFVAWTPTLGLGASLAGKTLGIVGAGRIGRAVAKRGRAFGMDVLEWTRKGELGLDALLEQSDFVSLHVPGVPETRHMIGARELELMKSSAILVNTARGTVVDERALVEALKTGAIRAAGLDVYENEPALTPGLAELPNVVLAPHLGSATHETRDAMAALAAENIVACANGVALPTRVV